MHRITKELLPRFMKACETGGAKINEADADAILSLMVDVIRQQVGEHEKSIYSEIVDIQQKIEKVKQELAEKMPNGVVPEATQELDAVMKATEDATNKILDSAERIREVTITMDDKIVAKKCIEDEVVKIFEACNFQDITGQRIKKVTSTLQYIENSVGNIIKTFEIENEVATPKKKKSLEEITDKDLMNGPQLDAETPSQDDVDKLFDSV